VKLFDIFLDYSFFNLKKIETLNCYIRCKPADKQMIDTIASFSRYLMRNTWQFAFVSLARLHNVPIYHWEKFNAERGFHNEIISVFESHN